MHLVRFMKRRQYKANARDVIKRMNQNKSLKEKLASKTYEDDTVTITIDETIELFESVLQMMTRDEEYIHKSIEDKIEDKKSIVDKKSIEDNDELHKSIVDDGVVVDTGKGDIISMQDQ
ncbi:hypothetical protein [Diatraea saccharalis granulovirus]|uniref:Uncharacterized protein n=1 Tax=Diatraea saccharalis granulovirus TaxID=1675862 RepID=A0A0R7EYV7_9BBAC|nr:hypothetical protein [Diatraea saccharalis granulovirus]AKN80766.1 hypothetical protein [Diatraea saccharalis granulovirus]